MNIFAVDSNPLDAARMLCDQHVSKMILESMQMLSDTHRVLRGKKATVYTVSGRKRTVYQLHDDTENFLYKTCNPNHGCTRWVRESSANYWWLVDHVQEMHYEFQYRFGKDHKSFSLFPYFSQNIPANLPACRLTKFFLAMPEHHYRDNPVDSYRKFYYEDKVRSGMARWNKGRPAPDWVLDRLKLDKMIMTA